MTTLTESCCASTFWTAVKNRMTMNMKVNFMVGMFCVFMYELLVSALFQAIHPCVHQLDALSPLIFP